MNLGDFKDSEVLFLSKMRTGGKAVGKKIYLGNIPFKATEEDIRELFSQNGEVESVKIITDANSGQSKGFGFVEMTTEEAAQKAITALNGAAFMERTLSVAEAKPQAPRENRGGFDGRRPGGAGGYGGRSGSGGGKGPGRGRR